MKFSPEYFLVTLSFVLLGVSTVFGQASTAAPPSNQTNYLYNGTTSLLSLTRNLPITITINKLTSTKNEDKTAFSLGDVLAKVNFVDADKAKVEGSKTEGKDDTTIFPLKLSYSGEIKGENIAVSSIEMDFSMVHNHKTGYWNVSSLDISLTGKMENNCTEVGCDVNLKNTMNVAPKKGYTSKPVDLNCQRDYTLCAPANLCWTCYDQQVVANLEADPAAKLVLTVLIPGMRLQPLVTNGTANFGYRWDCDPIWSTALWFSLLLGLFLIAILAWGIEMLVTLQTPSRFDDPKGKTLVVPLTD